MASSLQSYAEFDQLLASVRIEVEARLKAAPNDGAIASDKRQLDALHGWTRNGRCPSQADAGRHWEFCIPAVSDSKP